jgi:catechol-2,3-dioxygenase
MPKITGLGHLGLFCKNLENMREFYSRFMGLTITDEDLDRGIVFLSADPTSEHHELALARLRGDAEPTQHVQQISFIVKSMDDLKAFYQRIKQEGLRLDRTVTHGISCSLYFYDIEDNRIELYYKTGYNVKQPLGEAINLDDPTDDILAFSKSFETTLGPPVGASK